MQRELSRLQQEINQGMKSVYNQVGTLSTLWQRSASLPCTCHTSGEGSIELLTLQHELYGLDIWESVI